MIDKTNSGRSRYLMPRDLIAQWVPPLARAVNQYFDAAEDAKRDGVRSTIEVAKRHAVLGVTEAALACRGIDASAAAELAHNVLNDCVFADASRSTALWTVRDALRDHASEAAWEMNTRDLRGLALAQSLEESYLECMEGRTFAADPNDVKRPPTIDDIASLAYMVSDHLGGRHDMPVELRRAALDVVLDGVAIPHYRGVITGEEALARLDRIGEAVGTGSAMSSESLRAELHERAGVLPEDLDESRAIRREVAAAARELGMEARDAALDPLVDASTAVATDEPRGVPALEAAAAAYAAAMKGSSLDYEAARLDLHSSVLRALSDGSEAPTPVQRALALGFSGAVSGPNRTESSTEQVRATAFVAQDLARMPGEDLARRLGVEQYDLPPILMNSFTLLALGKEMNQAADRVELAERAASQCRIVQPGEYHERSGAFVGVSPQAGIAVVRAEDGLWGYRDAELFAGVQPGEQVRATMTPDGLSVEGPAELEQETSGHVAIVSQAAEAGD